MIEGRPMNAGIVLKCTHCGVTYKGEEFLQLCQKCRGILNIYYDYESIRQQITTQDLQKRSLGIWKYVEILPLASRANIVSLGEGGTFLHKCERLGRELGLINLFIKNETTNPTGSFIDRGTAVEVSKAKELGIRTLICGGTGKGNLGASIAAYAAKAAMDCTIHLSEPIDQGKLYQMIAFGATIKPTNTSKEARDKVQSFEPSKLTVTPADPLFLEGEKTTGLEICEQLTWNAPDQIIVPMGNGGHLSMIWKGLKEAVSLDFLEDLSTTMVGVQAAGCAPIVQAFQKGAMEVEPLVEINTIVKDLSFKNPLMGYLAIETLQESEGTALAVSDEQMLESAHLLAKKEGIFAELAASSTIACAKRLVELGKIDPTDVVVCVITGMGLKDPSAMRRFIDRAKNFKKFIHPIAERTFSTKMGETKQLILEILSHKEQYGYSIWKELTRRYVIKIKIPTVYQHLAELERLDLIRHTRMTKIFGKPERKYYACTDRGKTVLRALKRMKT